MAKKYFEEYVNIGNYCSLEQVAKNVQEMIDTYGKDATLQLYIGRYDDIESRVCFQREETQEEVDKRLQEEEACRKNEFAHYLKLKEKFEGVTPR